MESAPVRFRILTVYAAGCVRATHAVRAGARMKAGRMDARAALAGPDLLHGALYVVGVTQECRQAQQQEGFTQGRSSRGRTRSRRWSGITGLRVSGGVCSGAGR